MKDNQGVSSRKLIDRLVPDLRWGAMRGLLTTTYELNPDFLEMDYLPSVFGLGAWDDRSWTTRIALEKRLSELDTAVILTQARRYHGRPRSLRLEVQPIVSPHGSAFHPKVTLLLFDRAVRLIVGSANLTADGYRRNREVVTVLTASGDSRKEAELIAQALTGAMATIGSLLTDDAIKLIRHALETLQPWRSGTGDSDTAFVWTHGKSRLWREFLDHWPAGEPIGRISIISPFWSEDAAATLTVFLRELRKMGALSPHAEVRLLTDAYEGADGTVMPVLPLGYAAQDWASLGVKATAQAVSSKVQPEELGGMEGFTGTRALHAKVVLLEGKRNFQAYLGSANFTVHGWGFLDSHSNANTEAGLVLRRSVNNPLLNSLLPELAGEPILLTGGQAHALRVPEVGPGDDPWPEFIKQVILLPSTSDNHELGLLIETVPGSCPNPWSAKLLDKEGIPSECLLPVERTLAPRTKTFLVSLVPQTLTRLLTEQEILICWSECPSGRPFPINVEASARFLLPVSPGSTRIEETHLLSYYQGRITWEELFPDPDPENGKDNNSPTPPAPVTGVDKSRIQSYQIREFVEALTGLRQDLEAAAESEPRMRLALLGPVSPIALAQTILEAVESENRTPTAAAFQLVEILACLNSVRSFQVGEKLRESWKKYLDEATDKAYRLLEQLCSSHDNVFASNKAFRRYQDAVLPVRPRCKQ